MDVVLTGFGLEDDRIRSPNEKYQFQELPQGNPLLGGILDGLSR